MAPRTTSKPTPPLSGVISEIDGLAQLSFLIQNALARCAAEHRLSLIQTRLLGVLRDRKPTMQELAKLLDLDKSSITGLIDRAEGRGLVKRVPSSEDRRSVLITLTKTARSLVAQVSSQFEREISTLLDCMSTSQRELLSQLVSQLLVEHATSEGGDLCATGNPKSSVKVTT